MASFPVFPMASIITLPASAPSRVSFGAGTTPAAGALGRGVRRSVSRSVLGACRLLGGGLVSLRHEPARLSVECLEGLCQLRARLLALGAEPFQVEPPPLPQQRHDDLVVVDP